jgi:UDP-N-acetylglucosamine transferase subunit ALG13
VKTTIPVLLVISLFVTLGLAEETSFSRVAAPDSKGRLTKAVLTLSDDHKAVEVQPAKGTTVSIPYAEIYKFSYEYTKKHRVNEESIFTAAIGVGAIVMLTKSKSHWLEIDYREGDIPKSFVLRMDKHEYIRILDAVKAHTGKDAEILGNADKR